MTKNKKQYKTSSHKNIEKKKQTLPKSYSKIFLINATTLILGCIILNSYSKRPEIAWLQNMLKSNYEIIKKYPNATIDERFGIKLGFNYAYLKFVRDNSPEDAVILFPNREIILKEPTQFTEAEFSSQWIYSFIYPRKVVIEGTETKDKITHVAIMNGWGYDKLNYQIENQQPNTILQINYSSN